MRRLSGVAELLKLVTAPSGPSGVAAVPSIADMRLRAGKKVPKMIFDFVDGGAGDENTLRANENDLRDVVFAARTLVDVRQQDTTATIAGQELPLPLVFGPAGLVRVVGNDGELAAVRAAGARGIPYTISTSSAWSIEEIADAATGPLWFQLYLWRSRELIKDLVSRAKAAGCGTLVLTVDVPLNANRIRDLRNGMSIPPKVNARNALDAVRHPRWLLDLVQGPPIGFRNFQGIAEGNSALSHSEFINKELSNLAADWDDLAWLRSTWDGPLLIKGITTVGDASKALAAGVDGIIVSNHGGRQLDGLPSAVSAVPRIVDLAAGRADVLLDGGVRTGVDIAKALAMGAAGVTVARPWVYGVAAGGRPGVDRVIQIFEQEFRQTLALLGANRARDIDRGFAQVPDSWTAPPAELDTAVAD
ncbi:alpha-hydroxy acid oxidase [Prauserella cavernicola]|uniref:Alpha-hydroxy-acid oxidizing protein n=1 Tax=Prauserella cavernicola TaxID=2800127 RepID=A0A934QXS5_9PSEU|nr:alpha-hydroxy acid oxidase [Prauserella cavernicola]MBK1787238.1 alpha-hydroxy-acid oxidizing protein [Prauserella cavernicola]